MSKIVNSLSKLYQNLVSHMSSNAWLRGQAESNPTLKRLVLYECPKTQARLRYHSFVINADARPHDHAWSFCAHILSGGYKHALFETSQDLSILAPQPFFEYNTAPGHTYYLHCGGVHKTTVTIPTQTLILQGPRKKKSWTRFSQNPRTYGNLANENSGTSQVSQKEYLELLNEFKQVCRQR